MPTPIRNQVREVSLADAFRIAARRSGRGSSRSPGCCSLQVPSVTMTTAANWPIGSARFRPGSSKAGVSHPTTRPNCWNARMDAGVWINLRTRHVHEIAPQATRWRTPARQAREA